MIYKFENFKPKILLDSLTREGIKVQAHTLSYTHTKEMVELSYLFPKKEKKEP